MHTDLKGLVQGQIAAHAAATAEGLDRLRTMSLAERARSIEAACRAAAIAMRDRAAAGLPPVRQVPWPQSTWDFLREHATRVRTQSPD